MPTASVTKQKLSLTLPTSVVEVYEERAVKLGTSTEREMTDRLAKCQAHTALTPIFIDDSGRARLSQLFGKLVTTQAELIAFVERTAEIKVGPVTVALDAQLLGRLESRRFSAPLEEVITRETLNGLMSFTGLI